MIETRKAKTNFWNNDAHNWPGHIVFKNLRLTGIACIQKRLHESILKCPPRYPIVDIGAGASNKDYFKRRKNPADREIICLDISDKMLSLNPYRRKVQSDMTTALPIADSCIGLCTSILTTRYLHEKEHELLLSEMLRILVPGGILLLIDIENNSYQNSVTDFNPYSLSRKMKTLGLVPKIRVHDIPYRAYSVLVPGTFGEYTSPVFSIEATKL